MGVETVLAVVAIATAAASTYTSIQAAEKREKAAKEAAALQKKQLGEQKKQAAIERQQAAAQAKREARIASAELAAGFTGAGAGGSALEGALLGLETSEQAAQDYIKAVGVSQNAQFGIAAQQADAEASAVSAQAQSSITQSILGFGSSLASGAVSGYSAYSSGGTREESLLAFAEGVG